MFAPFVAVVGCIPLNDFTMARRRPEDLELSSARRIRPTSKTNIRNSKMPAVFSPRLAAP